MINRQQDHKYLKYILPVLFFVFVLVWTKSRVKNQQKGLILIGSPEDIGMISTLSLHIEKHIKVPVLEYIHQKWRHNNDKSGLLQAFKTNSDTFRVVIVMDEQKLLDVKATYVRQIISQLHFFLGIENYLTYIDIYMSSTGKREFHEVSHYLTKLAKEEFNHKFNRILQLVVNLLFNARKNSLDQQLFFMHIQNKTALKSHYLGLKNGRLDVSQSMLAQSQQYMLALKSIIQNGSLFESKLVSMYYSACNDEKEKLQKWLVNILDKTVAVHFRTPQIYEMYRETVKVATQNLKLQVEIFDQCQPPSFQMQACQRQFFNKTNKI